MNIRVATHRTVWYYTASICPEGLSSYSEVVAFSTGLPVIRPSEGYSGRSRSLCAAYASSLQEAARRQ